MKSKKYFPLFTNLTEKRAVVFGAGRIAGRRIATLLDFVGELVVVAPECGDAVRQLAQEKRLVYREKCYEAQDLDGADLVLAATDDEAVNTRIYETCKERNILVNVASDQKKCDFHFPGILECDGVVLGFNGAGRDHKKVREVREKIERLWKEESKKT